MKKLILIITFSLFFLGAGCNTKSTTTIEPTVQQNNTLETLKQKRTTIEPTVQQNNTLETLKQKRMMTYREECRDEWQVKLDTVDKIVQGTPSITPEQARNLARSAGIIDENNYILDSDIWIKDCMDKKTAIFE
jgi:plasmid maintenance system antidote protein VapI